MVDAIKRVPGVGDVQVFGAGRYAMRIWLNPEKMAALNITARDVMLAVQAQNAVNPAGKIGAQPAPPDQQLSFTVKAPGRLTSVKEFENIVVRGQDSSIVRVGDIARVELGSETYSLSSSVNGMPAASIGIYEAPGGNAIQLVDNIKALLKNTDMPPGMDYLVSLDSTLAVRAGIEDIVSTLVIALGLVVLVVFIFLQGWRGTLIPAFAVPVSIVGAFIAFPLFGFSINTICLMGLVLAIGLVVDDAIVVVEAVKNHISNGEKPLQATIAAMKEVSGPIVSTALVISCVFIPTLLLPGVTGKLFEQFAVTIGMSIIISAFCALSLSPTLSAGLLKGGKADSIPLLGPFFKLFNKGFNKARDWYVEICARLIRHMWLSILLLAAMTALLFPLAKLIPSGFLPNEDQGYLFAALIMPEARSLQLTTAAADKVSELIRQNPNVKDVIAISGFSLLTGVQSTNNAFFFVMLKPWEERPNPDQSAQAVTAQLNALLTTKVSEGITMCFQPPAIAGVGSANGVTFMLEDRDGKGTEYLAEQTDIFVKEANKLPIFDPNNNGSVRSVMSFAVEQKDVRLDEEKCATLGVSISEANSLLQAYMGSLFINYITLYGQQWQVYIQAQGSDRTGTDMLKNFYVKNNTGSSVPLSTLVKITDIKGPEFLLRQNLYNSSKLMVTPAQGYSNSQAMEALEKTFEASMPSDMGYSYADMSYQEQKIQNGIGIVQIFLLSSVFVFLILAALYERWSLPLSIFMTVPIAALGAFLGLYWFGYELNLYAQIGLVMLIGLAAKNAILIVEFAVIEMERGKTLMEATLSAARIRLRPILMTSFAFILGCVPLALASGSGAYSRNIIGIVVIAGMTMATVVGIFLIPCSFYFIMKLFRIRIARKTVETEDPDEIIARKYLFHEAHESLKG
jgi:HAE1 family hydrophobic/amphiphilic exporter-1